MENLNKLPKQKIGQSPREPKIPAPPAHLSPKPKSFTVPASHHTRGVNPRGK
jgi:hypothetical protein